MSVPTEPGQYWLISQFPDVPRTEVEIYLSKKGYLRVRVEAAKKFRGDPNFQGKRLSTFSETWRWERMN